MRILYLPAYFSPEHAASSYLNENRNQAFADAGFDMTVFVPTPCRGVSPEVREEYCKEEHSHEKLYNGKMDLYRFPLYAEGKNPIMRALRYVLCWQKQYRRGLKTKKIDCIYLASTPPIQGMLGAFLKKRKKVPFVYNLQDVFPDSLVNNGLTNKGSLLWKIGRVIENFTYKHADKIIVISEDFKKNIMAKGVPEEKIVVVYNWVDQNAVVDVPREENKLFDKYGLDREKFYVTYNGNIGLSQNMDMLLEVASEFQEGSKGLNGLKGEETNPSNSSDSSNPYSDIHFVLVGNGAYLDEVKRIVAERHIENVHLLPFQPYEDISHVFSLGDVSLVISKPGTGAASVPSKTWSIMSASRPVLANFDENELKEILEGKSNTSNLSNASNSPKPCGIFTKAGDKVAFTDAILKLYHDRELCKEYGHNGRQFVMDNLTREVGTQKYVEVIKSVVRS